MKFKDKTTKIKVTFNADRGHVVHAIAVQIDSGTKLHEITRSSTATALELLFRSNGAGFWPEIQKGETATKANVKCEDLFPELG